MFSKKKACQYLSGRPVNLLFPFFHLLDLLSSGCRRLCSKARYAYRCGYAGLMCRLNQTAAFSYDTCQYTVVSVARSSGIYGLNLCRFDAHKHLAVIDE